MEKDPGTDQVKEDLERRGKDWSWVDEMQEWTDKRQLETPTHKNKCRKDRFVLEFVSDFAGKWFSRKFEDDVFTQKTAKILNI